MIRRKKNKKLFSAVLLALAIMIPTSLVASVKTSFAYVDYTNSNVTFIINNKLKSLTKTSNGFSDQRGVLYALSNLNCLCLWNDLANNHPQCELSDNVKGTYRVYIKNSISSFNSRFSESTGEKYIAINLDVNTDVSEDESAEATKTFANTSFTSIYNTTVDYCKKVADDLNSKMEGKNDSEKDKILTDNSSIIKALYYLINRIETEYSNARGTCKTEDNNYIFTKDLSALHNILTNETYKDIMEKGQALVESGIESNQKIEIGKNAKNLSDLFLSQFSGGDLDGKYYVNEAWLSCFASSSVYIPLEDKVGGGGFKSSLDKITQNNSEVSDAFYQVAGYKKPIYRCDTTLISKNKKGDATMITLGEFIKQIKDESSGALVTFKGKLTRKDDSDVYEIQVGGGEKAYEDNGEKAKTETVSASSKTVSASTSTTTSSKKTSGSSSDNSSGGPEVYNEDIGTFPLSLTITNSDVLTEPVFKYGKTGTKEVTGKVLMYNIIQDCKDNDILEDRKDDFLYINAFGDIVLNDNTVIVPAASNPFYLPDKDDVVYNPNTAAWMNFYPQLKASAGVVTVTDRDATKYAGFYNNSVLRTSSSNAKDALLEYNNATVGPIESSNEKTTFYVLDNDGDDTADIKNTQIADKGLPMDLGMYNSGADKVSTLTLSVNNSTLADDILHGLGSFYWITQDRERTIGFGDYVNMFPVQGQSSESEYSKCGFIGKSFYSSLTINSSGEYVYANERWDIEAMTDFFKEIMKGMDTTAGYEKNIKEAYDDETDIGFVTKTLKTLAEKVLQTMGQTKGVVGIRNAYQDNIFGTFLNFCKKYIGIVFVLITLYYLTRLARKITTLPYAVACIALGFGITYLSVFVIPVYGPIVLNGAVEGFTDNISYKSLIMRQERYINPYSTIEGGDSNNTLSESSINLYRLDDDYLENVCAQYGVNKDEILSGNSVVLDNDSGLFIQGDTIKMNLDKLFRGLTIKGEFVNTSSGYVYKTQSYKKVSTVMDYYTPYYLVVDNFIEQLNKMSDLFSMVPSQLSYGNSIYKDSFLVSSYLRSDLVLNGDNLTELQQTFEGDEGVYLYERVKDLYGENNIDFLGLSGIFSEQAVSTNLQAYSNTLWFQTMQRLGYYDDDGYIQDEEKIAEMIEYVNRQVKIFLLDNIGQMAYISDENLIKVTSLYAVCCMNNWVSDFGDVLYPQSLNYEELKLEDVLLPVLTKDYKRYQTINQNIVDYINADFGFPGLIFFIADCIFSFLVTNIMQYSVPVLYILLLVVILSRLALRRSEEMKVVFHGYMKIFGCIYACYLIFCVATSLSYKFNDSVWCLMFLFMVYALILSCMSTVLWCLATNVLDFGNTKVSAVISKIATRLPGFGSQTIRQAIQRINKRQTGQKSDYSDYDDIDSVYDDYLREDRDSYYDRNSDRRRRRIKKNRRFKEYDEYDAVDDDEDDDYGPL